MRSGRMRAALVLGALLALSAPFTATASAPHLTCGPKQHGRWESIPVRAFQPVSGLTSVDEVTAYTVDPVRARDVAVTNGVRIQLSASNGCQWENGYALSELATTDQLFDGSTSTIAAVGLLQGTALAAVRSSTGPHILRFDGVSWKTSDSGLPNAGSPKLLRTAGDGRTAYLTISPNDSDGCTVQLPPPPAPLPPPPPQLCRPLDSTPAATPTGLLYATSDAGATWSLRTGPNDLPGGGTGFSALAVDPQNANFLSGIVGGSLLTSHDGGATWTTAPGSGYTAITPLLYPGFVVAFDGKGHGQVFFGGTSVVKFPAPQGITSAAARAGDSTVMVESSGHLRMVSFAPSILDTPAVTPARTGSLLGDISAQSTFHALSGHSLLRYVDPLAKAVGQGKPIAAGDVSVAAPKVGTVDPLSRDVRLLVGQSAVENFTLDLPKNPTPLDLFFLIDVSTSMSTYIDNLKANLHKVVDKLQAQHIQLNVGVGTLGTAPAKGEAPYPDTYAYPPQADANGHVYPAPVYHKPRIYQLIKKIGAPGVDLDKAINSVQLETDPPPSANAQHSGTFHEGQLLALDQMVTGSGVKSEQDDQANLNTYSAVAPGQDAGWRGNPDVRRIVVIASDETFDAPYGTPEKPGSTPAAPILDFAPTLKILNEAHIGVFGITAGSPDSVPDMTTLARGTNTFSPPGGVSCGGDPEVVVPAGAPLVCSQEGDFSGIIATVLSKLTDRQDVHLLAPNLTPVLRGLDARHLTGLDVKQPNSAAFSVAVSCANVLPGTYAQDVTLMLRDYVVGTTRLYVTCVAPQAAVPPVPIDVPPHPPVVAAVQPPVPPPPPPPAANPQPQPNINPLTVGATQEQQEMQLALALNDALSENDEGEGVEQMAMVDRRKREPVQALGVLAFAMTTCAGLGLAKLRARPDVSFRTAR